MKQYIFLYIYKYIKVYINYRFFGHVFTTYLVRYIPITDILNIDIYTYVTIEDDILIKRSYI